MQQEDDLRALENIVQFARALGVFFLILHIYWFCYGWLSECGLTWRAFDHILLSIQRTTLLFSHPITTKLCCLLFLALGCYGTKSVRNGKVGRRHIAGAVSLGFPLFFLNGMLLELPAGTDFRAWSYIATLAVGYLCLLAAGVWLRRLLKQPLADDPFNDENESFLQEERCLGNDYSVNLPTRYRYKSQWRQGWINVINPFRGRRRINRAISVKLIYWLKLNVNNLKSAIWVIQRKITENIRKGMTSGWLGTSVGNYRFCFPEFPTNLRTPNGLNSIILSQFGMCK